MLGQSLQSLLNTYSGKTPTDFSDRFPGMMTKYAPRVRLSLAFIEEIWTMMQESYPLLHPHPAGDHICLLPHTPPLLLYSLI